MLSLLSAVPVNELKELFSWVLKVENAESEVDMHVYEIEPIDKDTLTEYIIHGTDIFPTDE